LISGASFADLHERSWVGTAGIGIGVVAAAVDETDHASHCSSNFGRASRPAQLIRVSVWLAEQSSHAVG